MAFVYPSDITPVPLPCLAFDRSGKHCALIPVMASSPPQREHTPSPVVLAAAQSVSGEAPPFYAKRPTVMQQELDNWHVVVKWMRCV